MGGLGYRGALLLLTCWLASSTLPSKLLEVLQWHHNHNCGHIVL